MLKLSAHLILIAVLAHGTAMGQIKTPGPTELPYKAIVNYDGVVIDLTNSNGSAISAGSARATGISAYGLVGVFAHSTLSNGRGAWGSAEGVGSIGLRGDGKKGATGVVGESDGAGDGVRGASTEGNGVVGTSGGGGADGVVGETDGTGDGVRGTSAKGNGVVGVATGPKGKGIAGKGYVGVYGEGQIAGFFKGQTTVDGRLLVSIVDAKEIYGAKKLFRIDHPLDPADKYLVHSSVESSEMTNLYSGNAVLDSNGEASIELPGWFEALNADFRYQLTCVGRFAPVYIAQEIQDSRFRIAGGTPGLKVSWQVTSIRHDAYAKAHPLQVEEEKAPGERGRYLNPAELGFEASRGIAYDPVTSIDEELPAHLRRANRSRNLHEYARR